MKRLNHVVIYSVLAFITILTACNGSSASELETELDVDVESFEYTNQNNETVSLSDLEGTYWVANFIFTNCNTVCPPMTANMASLQEEANNADLDVRFISFSVDPEVDDPDKLKTFSEKYDADYSNWDFLTGYSQDHIESFAADSFNTLVSKVDGQPQVNHGTSFALVNPDGTVIKNYSGTSKEAMDDILNDLKTVTQ
ncbi:protein SCO1/2 [Alkalibacillus flavidus]|uniref:Protein SCO1/2 n=1 Tax=Alkalibacillus flavidus TaxID=546021 RepID=A0ABV2KTQ6_9BACI